jgi:hypothetical protein
MSKQRQVDERLACIVVRWTKRDSTAGNLIEVNAFERRKESNE